MKCDDLIKENYKVYMIDDRGIKLDLENDLLIQKYEKANDVKVINMVSDFLNTHDEKFNNIILQIEKMVKEYSIDYFIYGNGTGGSKDALALMYNLKNRKSSIDCNLKVFYNYGNSINDKKVSYMIDFSDGSSGSKMGYSFYRYFNASSFYEINKLLEKYFSCEDDGKGDKAFIGICNNNIKTYLEQYYS